MALNIMYCVDVPLHAASGLFMFTLPPKRGTTRKQKLIKKGELRRLRLLFVFSLKSLAASVKWVPADRI